LEGAWFASPAGEQGTELGIAHSGYWMLRQGRRRRGSYGEPVRLVGVDDRQAMVVRVTLTKDTIKWLVDGKKLFIFFRLIPP